jgi:hypothetical protein
LADTGAAAGQGAMAKAVVPMRALREKFGDLPGEMIGPKLQDLARDFLAHDQPPAEKKKEAAGIKN